MKKLNLGKTLVLLLFVYLIWILGNGLLQLYKAGGRVDLAKERLLAEQKKNQELKKKFSEVQDPEFVEKEAREKLNMQKPGETVVILPEMNVKSETAEDKKQVDEPNWQKWLDLFK